MDDLEIDFPKFHVIVQHFGEPISLDGIGEKRRYDFQMQTDHRLFVHERDKFVAQVRSVFQRVETDVHATELGLDLQIRVHPFFHGLPGPDAQHLTLVLGVERRQEQSHIRFRTIVEHALLELVVEHR